MTRPRAVPVAYPDSSRDVTRRSRRNRNSARPSPTFTSPAVFDGGAVTYTISQLKIWQRRYRTTVLGPNFLTLFRTVI